MASILVTGAAGFVGFHACRRLAADGWSVTGVDCFNAYYDPALKRGRAEALQAEHGIAIRDLDIADAETLKALALEVQPDRILHLAAQAGVRYGFDHPFEYEHSNLKGHLSVLEAARALGNGLGHLVYASSSSVYGEREGPFKESDAVDHPASLYAATKRAGEMMTESYVSLFGLPATGLRFFTVYGPWGRPDMAYFKFAEAILDGRKLPLFDSGRGRRDFTYVDDVVECLARICADAPAGKTHRIFNIGGSNPRPTTDLVKALETSLGRTAQIEHLPPQPGDVSLTYADTTALEAAYDYKPVVKLEDGIARFADWYLGWRGGKARSLAS